MPFFVHQLPPVAPGAAPDAAPAAAAAEPPAAPPPLPPPGDPWFIDSSFDGEAADAPAPERLEPYKAKQNPRQSQSSSSHLFQIIFSQNHFIPCL